MDGGATLWLAAAKSFANLVVKTGWDIGNQDISTPIKQKIFEASRQYIQNYQNRHGSLKVLGMSRPVSLESIYTKVQLLDAKIIQSFDSVETLEAFYRQTQLRSFKNRRQDKQLGIDVANREQYVTVLGGPGVGKSTFLRKIGLEALKGKRGEFHHSTIPVFLELKQVNSENTEIEQLIVQEFKICNFPDPEGFTKKALLKGRLLILLDGLDEVPDKYLTRVISSIVNFTDQYSKNRFIISCRQAAYHSYFKRSTDVAVEEFNNGQIEQVLHNWFQSEIDKQRGTAAQCWQELQKPENAAALELAQTPLLLTFLCLVYDRSQRLPENRSTLYRKALDILLEEWASEKRIHRDDIYQGLHIELEKALLSEIAYTKFSGGRLFFSKQEIINQITAFLSQTLDAPKHLLDGKSILHAIEVQQGILVERAENIYSFSHLTIQEFLTARHIVNNYRRLEILIANKLTNNHWREVILLIAGLQDSADDLLLTMERHALAYIESAEHKQLMLMISQISLTIQGDYKPSAKRALAAANAIILALENESKHNSRGSLGVNDFLYGAMNNSFDLATELDLQLVPTFNHNNSQIQAFTLSLISKHSCKSLRNHIKLLSHEKLKSFADYLTAAVIIVKCKKAAIRVSPKAWHSIEKKILC